MEAVWSAIGPINFGDVTSPTLAIYALWEGAAEQVFPRMALLDSAGHAAVRAFHAKWTPGGRDELRRQQADRARALPKAEVATIAGGKHSCS